MGRIAVGALGVALGAALAAAAQAPSQAAARSPVLAAAAAAATGTKPPPKRSPTPVATEPQPTQQCPGPGQASSRVTSVPWAQDALDWSSAWPMTRGQGVTVAVVDSGVDRNTQLAGKVTAIDLTGTGYGDCVGHGTEIAGIIAASDLQPLGFPFEGVAPAAKILSVKVNSAETGSSALLAQGIRAAALLGAQVINVSVVTRDTPALRSAVLFALRKNAVIVAAGGNDESSTGVGPFYPASYPGVLSVGAVAQDGSLPAFSDQRSHVAVTAPGVNVTSTCPGGYQVNDLLGTSYATAFVSGVAALVRARYPALAEAAVVSRIEHTADGAAGPGTGYGLVNPLQAVSAILPPGAAQTAAPGGQRRPVPVSRPPLPDRAAIDTALRVTAGALGAAALMALGGVVISQGRRRRWRAGPMKVPGTGEAGGGLWPDG